MDFKLSYNWVRDVVDVDLSPQELAERLSLHSMSVERLHPMDAGLDASVVVGRIETIAPHPNADKLRIAIVRATPSSSPSGSGGGESVRVVCGGTNPREGMLVAFAPVGATVRWHGEGDPITLEPATIRGERSEGMICAASEIGLGGYFAEGEREILDLTGILGADAVGRPLAEALELNDVVLDVEVTTNRPDCMSVMGLAREVAAMTGARVRVPRAARGRVSDAQRRVRSVEVRVDDARACPMYTGTVIAGVTVAPSPWWMQRRLLAGGIRPISNVVDVTNYVLLETGQPLHVFDAARLSPSSRGGAEVVVRRAKDSETIVALDGKTYALTPEMLVIADAEHPVAIAGVIGGAESAVTAGTTTVVLEAATFDPVVVRKTWRALDLRTESSLRYEKGVPVESVEHARARAVELLCAVAGGTVAGKPVVRGKRPPGMRAVAFDLARASEVIGVSVAQAKAKRVLIALGCAVDDARSPVAPLAMRRGMTRLSRVVRGSASADASTLWKVTPPWWRRGDLEREHDLIEELARMVGYHTLPSVLPEGTLPASVVVPTGPVSMFDWEDRARTALAAGGATEVMAFSMISAATLAKFGGASADAVALENPLTDDLTHLRPSLLPSVLEIIARNQGEVPAGTLFEMGSVYGWRREPSHADGALPTTETMRLAIARYGKEDRPGALVRELRGVVEHMLGVLGVWPSPSSRGGAGGGGMWHPGRVAELWIAGTPIATLGELHPNTARAFGIEHRVAIADINWAALLPHLGTRGVPARPPEQPAARRDLAFILDRTTPYADLAAFFASADPLLESAELFDEYEGSGIPAGKKSLAFHLTYRAADRTLATEEVSTTHDRIAAALAARFGASLRA